LRKSILSLFQVLSEDRVTSTPVKLAIVGLGRWAKVLTRASAKSPKLKIVAGYSRSKEKRDAFLAEMGVPAAPTMEAILEDKSIEGVILTVPNEQHLPMA
jgi:predicted dehydrogenase